MGYCLNYLEEAPMRGNYMDSEELRRELNPTRKEREAMEERKRNTKVTYRK